MGKCYSPCFTSLIFRDFKTTYMTIKSRNYLFDNAKFLAIILVVYGHLIEPLIKNNEIIKAVYMMIYSIHMPIFVLISGMFASINLSDNRLLKLITSTLIPLFAFTFIYELANLIVFKRISSYSLGLQPYWILWFLFSLFFWKLSLPKILNFRFPIMLSVAISIGAGYVDSIGYFLGISRTLYFFPFFIIGYKLYHSELSIEKLAKYPKLIYITIILSNFVLIYYLKDMPHQWLYGSLSYQRLENTSIYAGMIRLSLYGVSFVSSIALLSLIPNKKYLFSSLGDKSLFVYIWHGFFIKLFIGTGIIIWVGELSGALPLITLFILALLVTLILSMNFISQYTRQLILDPLRKYILNNR